MWRTCQPVSAQLDFIAFLSIFIQRFSWSRLPQKKKITVSFIFFNKDLVKIQATYHVRISHELQHVIQNANSTYTYRCHISEDETNVFHPLISRHSLQSNHKPGHQEVDMRKWNCHWQHISQYVKFENYLYFTLRCKKPVPCCFHLHDIGKIRNIL